jgi:hypothetical protein
MVNERDKGMEDVDKKKPLKTRSQGRRRDFA